MNLPLTETLQREPGLKEHDVGNFPGIEELHPTWSSALVRSRKRPRPAPASSADSPARTSPPALNILVVEGDPCDALLLEQAFFHAAMHMPLQFVDDGQEAIDYLSAAPPYSNRFVHPLPTLLLLALRLAQRSGFEVLDWVRRQPELKKLQVVVFSVSKRPQDIERAYALGADAYLVKPEDVGELGQALECLKEHWFANGVV